MNFKERSSSDKKRNSSVVYAPTRYYNAVIGSYFRTLKESILGRKKKNCPAEVIMELHRSVATQIEAHEFSITQNSKVRKRRKQMAKEEK